MVLLILSLLLSLITSCILVRDIVLAIKSNRSAGEKRFFSSMNLSSAVIVSSLCLLIWLRSGTSILSISWSRQIQLAP